MTWIPWDHGFHELRDSRILEDQGFHLKKDSKTSRIPQRWGYMKRSWDKCSCNGDQCGACTRLLWRGWFLIMTHHRWRRASGCLENIIHRGGNIIHGGETLGSKDILIVAWKINFENREERTFVQRQETQQNPLWDQAPNKRERNPLSYFCLVQIFERLLVEKYTECSLRWKMKCWWTINNNNECLLFNSSLLFLDFMGLWGSMPNDFISDSKINQIVRSQIYLEES